MDVVTFNRFALPTLFVLFVLVTLAWPTWRLVRRTGQWPIALDKHHGRLEWWTGWTFVSLATAFCVWVVQYARIGPDRLHVWRVPAWIAVVGWGIVTAAFVGARWAQSRMGDSWRMGTISTRTELVTHGPFRNVRHPIYACVLAAALGVAMVTPSPWTLSGVGVLTVALYAQAREEERHLEALHGDPYRRYLRRSGRFLPRR